MRDIISCLNFKTLHLILGNYERDAIDKVMDALEPLGRDIELVESAEFYDPESQRTYHIVHEPDEGSSVPEYPGDVVLFGHIHGRAVAKKNGFDLAADYHNFTPISVGQVRWLANAIQYWDHNVFCDKASI